ncbi:MAG: flagellar motor switch protein FliN [Treponema sp.]|jgi:flagellar motor switch protein FliN/FliY|nr:flagellar motor switch protein FliN [Treponema sp.]
MSDGALSQDELDALLSGVDTPNTASEARPAGDLQALEDFLASTVESLSSNLSAMTGAAAVMRGPKVVSTNRDTLLEALPDTITVVKVDFSSGFPGEHLFLMAEGTAKLIASLMNKEENITLDEMALSVIGEAVSQMAGTQITALTNKTGNKSIASVSPEVTNVTKAVAALPGGDFLEATYDLSLGEEAHQVWEVYGPTVSAGIVQALSGGTAAEARASAKTSGGVAPGMGGMQGMGGMMGGGMPGMGQPTNVQSVQFPGLSPQAAPQEQGNIGLIMDVYMEMTVELGRTKKLIKEILGMGEGTIIELDKLAGEPVDILVNHKLIAKGEVVVIDENFGVRVTEIVSPIERMSDMG